MLNAFLPIDRHHPERILLIGIDCGHMHYLERDVYAVIRDLSGEKQARQTNLYVDVNTGLAIVIGAWKLDELLNIQELLTMREDENRRRKKAASYTKLDSATRPRLQKTVAPNEADRIEIPIPSKGEVLEVFKKVTRKRETK